ncbi:MAG: hypothetical protein GX445_05050 [Elusimicrobia bacterium]|nr:hypothetical protein [Elusimicrobiota bacterium]
MKINELNSGMIKYIFLFMVGIFLSFVIPSLSKEIVVDFDNKADINQEVELVSEDMLYNNVKPQVEYNVINKKNIYTLNEAIKNCPKEKQIEFYKSIVIVNGRLASINNESVKGCFDKNVINSMDIFTNKDTQKDENCLCIFRRLGCRWFSLSSCDPVVCNGPCEPVTPYKGSAGYMDMSDLFNEVPREVVEEFAGSLIINDGRISGCYYGGLLNHLGTEKTRGLLENIIAK